MEEIFKYIGNYGKYQVFMYVICSIAFLINGSLTLMSTFTAGMPNTRCYIPGYDDNATNYNSPFNASNDVSKYLFPPPSIVSNAKIYCYYCNTSFIDAKENCTKQLATSSCSGNYIYDTSQYKSTLVSLFHMVCDDVWMGSLLESLYMVGTFFGSAIFGVVSDKFGRRTAFLTSAVLQIIIYNLVPFVSNYYLYCIVEIMYGGLQAGTFLTSFVIIMEQFGGPAKTVFGIGAQGIFSLGYVYVGIAAYFIRDWRWLTWSVSFLTALYIPCFWLFPESIRWLVVNNKIESAQKIISKVARCNRIIIPEAILQNELTVREEKPQASILDLFKNFRMALITLIVFFTWMVSSMTYYGLSWNTASLPGNPYVNFIISGLVEIPAYVICVPLMELCGRRLSLVGFFFIGGTSCVISGLIAQKYAILGLTFVGKLCISAAYAIIYNYTAEIFPTVVRNTATGFSSVCARIGSIAAPQIVLLGDYAGSWLPVVIYGSLGIVASVLDWFLPETKGKQMAETIEDGIQFISKTKRPNSITPVSSSNIEYSDVLKF